MPSNQSVARRIEDLRDQIDSTLDEMLSLISNQPNCDHITSRANAYWYPQIKMVLSNESGYLGGSMCSVEDTINELKEEYGDEEE